MFSSWNDKIGEFLVRNASTMGFFWVCVIMDITPLIFPSTTNIAQFISTTVVQLLMLPLLSIQNNKQMDKIEQILESIQSKEEKEDSNLQELLKYVSKPTL